MTGTAIGARRFGGLAAYEWLFVAFGSVTATTKTLLIMRDALPPTAALVALCVFSALSVHFSAVGDNGGKVSASAQGMVIAAGVLAFRDSSPLLGSLLVGMSAAFWRIPRTRQEWLTVPGNFGIAGLPALCAAALLCVLPTIKDPSAIVLAAVALPLSLVYAVVNGGLTAAYVVLCERVSVKEVLRELRPHVPGAYVPFLFGAFLGELSLRFGLVVFVLAAAVLVMVQAVFASYRAVVDSEREALEGLVAAVERKDPYTAGHSKRVMRFARYMGEGLGKRGRDLVRLEQHALMHDIGKLVVPNHVLRKPGKLDAAERELMFRHEPAGAAMLSAVPFLSLSADIAQGRGHREGFDGEVRDAHIVHAADAFDAMTSTRAYRRAHPQEKAFAEMRDKAGRDFHPACVEALIAELDARGEVHGAGHEKEVAVFEVAPPVAALGSTLADEAAADAAKAAKSAATVAAPALQSRRHRNLSTPPSLRFARSRVPRRRSRH